MGRYSFLFLFVLTFTCCSNPQPHHLPDSAAYKQQETEVLVALCGQVMNREFFVQRLTGKTDTIAVYDSLRFPPPLPDREIQRLKKASSVVDNFLVLLTDTTNWADSHTSIIHPPLKQMIDNLSFTPKVISPGSYDGGVQYRLSRVIFSPDFSQAYFQVTWSDPGGGVMQYVICQKVNGGWVVKLLDNWNSFKI